jgi:hypothetical protein
VLTYAVMIHALFNLFSLYRLNGISEETIENFEWSSPDPGGLAVSIIILLAALALLARHTASRT